MSVHAISDFFALGLNNWHPLGVELPTNPIIELNGAGLSEQEIVSKAILSTYDIRTDDANFRNNPALFEQQRGDYPTRREFPAYTIRAKNVDVKMLDMLRELGFNF